MSYLGKLRRAVGTAFACLFLAALASTAQTHKPLPMPQPMPNTGSNHRLVLKDGSYQIVRKYEIVGDRVRYISLERGGDWEEMPESLVDWEATRKWERDHADQVANAEDPSPAMTEAESIDKEEAAERAEQAA